MNSSQSKKAFRRAWIICVAALLLVASLCVFFLACSVTVGGSRYRTTVTELELSGENIDDFSVLERFSALEYLDLRDTGLTLDEYTKLKASLEDCAILWSVPIGTQLFDSDISEIKLDSTAGLTADQLEALRYMEALTSFDISGTGADAAVGAKLNQLESKLDNCTFLWDIELGGQLFSHDITALTLPSETSAEEYEKLLLFTSLTTVDATAVKYTNALGDVLSQLSQDDCLWCIDLAGVSISSAETEADISGHTVDELETFSAALNSLPNLTRLEMCDCGLTNEQMEQLMKEHPSVKFVWTISFARWTGIRTDITCFSSLNSKKQLYGEKELEPLFKYCTDLIALDLGHSSIKDFSLITNLTKLQALILGDNKITDISPLAALTELEYLELWKNDFTDVSVLTTLPNLKDINLSYCNDIKDFEPLMELKCVEMLWLQNTGFPSDFEERLREKYPDCMFSFYAYNTSHGNGWCAQERYLGIRKAFRNWRYVICYTSWDDVVYQEGVSLLPAIKKWD